MGEFQHSARLLVERCPRTTLISNDLVSDIRICTAQNDSGLPSMSTPGAPEGHITQGLRNPRCTTGGHTAMPCRPSTGPCQLHLSVGWCRRRETYRGEVVSCARSCRAPRYHPPHRFGTAVPGTIAHVSWIGSTGHRAAGRCTRPRCWRTGYAIIVGGSALARERKRLVPSPDRARKLRKTSERPPSGTGRTRTDGDQRTHSLVPEGGGGVGRDQRRGGVTKRCTITTITSRRTLCRSCQYLGVESLGRC